MYDILYRSRRDLPTINIILLARTLNNIEKIVFFFKKHFYGWLNYQVFSIESPYCPNVP